MSSAAQGARPDDGGTSLEVLQAQNEALRAQVAELQAQNVTLQQAQVAALPQEVVELRRGSEPSRGVEVPPPPPIVPPGHSVLEVSLALTNGSYGIRIGLDSASRVVITDFTEHEVMAAGALRVGDVVLSVHGFDASRASFDEVVEKFGDAKSADAMVVLGVARPEEEARAMWRRVGARLGDILAARYIDPAQLASLWTQLETNLGVDLDGEDVRWFKNEVTQIVGAQSTDAGALETPALQPAAMPPMLEAQPAPPAAAAASAPIDPLWAAVERGERLTTAKVLELYPGVSDRQLATIPRMKARRPKIGPAQPSDVWTYLPSDVIALVARLAAPVAVDPLWAAVERGERLTAAKVHELYHGTCRGLGDGLLTIPRVKAQQPLLGASSPREVWTYLPSDVTALVARLAVPAPAAVDPLWAAVERGERLTAAKVRELYPGVSDKQLATIPRVKAQRPELGFKSNPRVVWTYLPSDVSALAARLAAPVAVDPLWAAVERGERLTAAKVLELYPGVFERQLATIPRMTARRPKIGLAQPVDVWTYLPSDVTALIARLAAPAPAAVDPLWAAVERGERLTRQKALELYPSVSERRFRAQPSLVARQPAVGINAARDVHTYLLSDVEALAAQVAAELADPTWQAVERGERLATSQVYELYPCVSERRLRALPSVVARRPTIGKVSAQNVYTYLRTDVEALASKIAAELADPTWQAVERGERLTKSKVHELYPSISRTSLEALTCVVARQPTVGTNSARNVKTYLRTDVEALAATIAGDNVPPAPKRPRVEKAAPPRVEKAPPRVDPCPVCLEDLGDDATALDCGHRIHVSCLEEYSKNAWADGTAATRTRRGTRLTCPCCRAPSLVADPVFRVGDEVEAKWGGAWHPGVVDEVLSEEGSYEVLWDDTGQCNPIPARDVQARAT